MAKVIRNVADKSVLLFNQANVMHFFQLYRSNFIEGSEIKRALPHVLFKTTVCTGVEGVLAFHSVVPSRLLIP